MKTDVALDLHNVDPALDLLHHHKKQIDPYGLDLHHRYCLYLTSDMQLLDLHRQLPQTMTISILLPTILGELQRHAIIVTQNCGPQKHPYYAVPMVKLIYPPYKLYQNLYTSCSWGILQNLDVFEIIFKVTIQLSHSHHLV